LPGADFKSRQAIAAARFHVNARLAIDLAFRARDDS
jgi:hypothetical protein